MASGTSTDQKDGVNSSASLPDVEPPTKLPNSDKILNSEVCELFFEILQGSKLFIRNCNSIENVKDFSNNLLLIVEKNKVEKLLLTFKDQLRNKLESSELYDTSEDSINILTTDFKEAAKEFLKLSKTNLECILKRRSYFKVNDYNLQVISLICSKEFFESDYNDFDFLKSLIILNIKEKNFDRSLIYCLIFCNYIISSF